MSKDIALIIHGWANDPDEVTVRRIAALDGSARIQMRLDLGVLQMELAGRPDGKRPHGHESLLEYYEERLTRYGALGGEESEFGLDPAICAELKQESMQYYYRYLSMFHLGEYRDVIRDTERNLRLFDFVRDYAQKEDDRLGIEQLRPYVLMMNTRARACICLESQKFERALQQIEIGVERIEDFFLTLDRGDLLEGCKEIAFLRDWSERIRDNKPLSPTEKIKQQLSAAVEREDYERAAKLRDELRQLPV